MNLRSKKKFQKKLRKVRVVLFPALVLVLVATIGTAGYFYFFESKAKADYYFHKAQSLDEANPYGSREAVRYYTKAISSYEAVGDRGAAVNAYIDLGLLHYKFGNITQVERMVLSAMEIGGEDIPKPMKAKAFMLLAGTVEPEKAKKYITQAIAISDELGQKVMTVKSYYILAKIYEYKANFTEAQNSYLKAIKILENIGADDGFFDPEPLYADLAELYVGEGNVNSSITYYEKALGAARANTEHGIAVAIYMKTLGDLYHPFLRLLA
jgi:tetratricopeptide (TPR) repeat protein